MENFEFYNPARIIFGKGEENNVGDLLKQHGATKVLLHYGGGSVHRSGLYGRIVASLKKAGLAFVELGGVCPNPRLCLAREGMALCKAEQVDFILAVGGGSVIDSAKCIAAGTVYDGDIWECYLDSSKPVCKALPIATVLTIPAAGSESSPGSVITDWENNIKRYINSEAVIPKFSILNPELTFTLPKYQIACGSSDILAHLMERYFCGNDNVDLTDRLLEAAARTILYYTPLALEDPENYDVRAEIMWAGTMAHNNILGMGRIEDWSSHDIEHELSAIYDIAHGAGLSIIFPAWMKYVYHTKPARFVQFAKRVFDVDFAQEHPERSILLAIQKLEAFYTQIGLPTRLSQASIDDSRLREMAEKCVVGRGTIGGFQELNADDIYEIYKLAL